jgi:DNA-binding transcriptional LysR family regulator
VLLVYEDEEQRRPWLSWQVWLEMSGQPRLRPAGSIAFNQYASAIRAAIDGQGVALATLGLVADLLRAGKLVAPLPQRFMPIRVPTTCCCRTRPATNPALAPFRDWLASRVKSGVGRTKLST